MAVQLKLTSKGQITLKKEFLQHLGADDGTVLDVEKLADGAIKISAKRPKKTLLLQNLQDCLAITAANNSPSKN